MAERGPLFATSNRIQNVHNVSRLFAAKWSPTKKQTNFMGHVQPTKLISLVRSLAKRDEENESANNKIPTRMRKVSKTSGQWVVRMTNKNHADKPMCCFWPCTLLSGHCSLSLSSSRLWPNDTSATLHIILDLYSRLDPCHLVIEPITLS